MDARAGGGGVDLNNFVSEKTHLASEISLHHFTFHTIKFLQVHIELSAVRFRNLRYFLELSFLIPKIIVLRNEISKFGQL